MPIIKSAKKRVRVARKATIRNAKTKRILRSALKSFQTSVSGNSHSKAQSALDKAGKHGLLHKNKVARKKRQLAAAARKAGVKTAGTKKAAKKTVAKKAAPKKSAVKKPAAKKTPAKKK
ncbi:MAG TPA: 30S ribosomal protein S20 [Candidatus Saccharimonadales bacterium]|nr:30S ribosomal protein S20 [Candidatus Saccharimonadales bacterium]